VKNILEDERTLG